MAQTITINGQEIPIEQFRNDWTLALMSQGVIVRLKIGRWVGSTKLTPEALGLKFAGEEGLHFTNTYLNLGTQKLMPPKMMHEIMTLDTRARTLLSNYSFDTVWGRFVPFTAFDQWERENKAIHDEYIKAAIALGSKYDEMIATIKEDYKNMAKDVWVRMYSEDKGNPTPAFIEDFVSKVVEKIPSQTDIISSFRYDTTYFVIPMPSFVADNIAKADQIKRESELAQFSSELEKDAKRRISEDYIKRKKELVDGFLQSTISEMRKYVAELCDVVLISISSKKGGVKVNTGHINKLKAMIKKVKLLNFYNDKEITDLLKDLEWELDKVQGDMNYDSIAGKLKNIVEETKKEFTPQDFNPSISILELP